MEIIFARHGLARLARKLTDLGARRAVILTTPSRRHLHLVTAALADLDLTVFDAAKVHVPVETVAAAEAVLQESRANAVIALGGGSTIGLGKALALAHDLVFAAIPTTYSGSEMTTLFGTTRDGIKQTGRDDRVRPDLVLYDATLTQGLAIGTTVQSLLNSMAHVVSALSTGSLAGEDRAGAVSIAGDLARVIEDLLLAPTAIGPREVALAASSAAGSAIDRGKLGVQHAVAHHLGGATGIDHAPLHAVILPQFVAWLRESDPGLIAELERATGWPDLEPALHDLLARAGVPTSLEGLGVDAVTAARLAAARPDLPARLILDAHSGLRPTGRGGRIALGPETALLAGPHPDAAQRIVLALHGRGAEPGGMVRRCLALAGNDPETSILGLLAGENRWYAVRYDDPGADKNAEVNAAIARVDRALDGLPTGKPVILVGFSQGACLALEAIARRGSMPGKCHTVIAIAGARIGSPAGWPPAVAGSHAGFQILVGMATRERHMNLARVEASAAWFRAAGAEVTFIGDPGEKHDIHFRQRRAARPLILGRPEPEGGRGLGNALESEAIPGALPRRQNSPRLPAFGLYAEQISGTGFTAPRADNRRVWLYRVRPSTQRRAATPLAHERFGAAFVGRAPEPNLHGFAPLEIPADARDFLDGLCTLGGAGDPAARSGYAIHRYAANRSMETRAFVNADGDLLVVPETGALTIMTELGPLPVVPGEIAILPAGLAFSVILDGETATGTVAESFGQHFRLPERGPAGANGLGDPRHFRAPAAWYEDRLAPDFRVITKLGGKLHAASQDHSPFDVVAWHGNLAPFVYDLADFSPLGATLHDHPDPSIYTVVGAPGLDFIAFVPRWEVATGTFRPPFFHRSAITEVNGIVREDPPPGSPFRPGAIFVTPPYTPHGTGGRSIERIRAETDEHADRPMPPRDGLWYQFECNLPFCLTPAGEETRLPDWPATWGSHRSYFRE